MKKKYTEKNICYNYYAYHSNYIIDDFSYKEVCVCYFICIFHSGIIFAFGKKIYEE